MVNNILSEMKPSLMRYAEVISTIANSVVSIIDNQMIRILYVGGEWRNDIGENVTEVAHIAQSAIETGRSQVMLEPASHPGCRKCTYKDRCKERVEMWTPIIANKEILGVIGFVAETKKQEEKIIAECHVYQEFLEQIADMIAYEAIHLVETQRNQNLLLLLESIFERLDSGVMVLDRNNMLSRLNKAGNVILKEKFYDLDRLPVHIQDTGRTLGYLREYELLQGSQRQMVAGNLHKLDMNEYANVLIFTDTGRMQSFQNRASVYESVVGTSQAAMELRDKIKMASASPSSVLITAEDGLNMELYAKIIHDESEQNEKPFVIIDCAILPREAPEKYLFGTASSPSVAGSRSKPGRLDAAIGGTLVLHNIDALSRELQQQFIQLLERKELTRIGSKKKRHVNMRIISTSRKKIRELSANGEFNSTLYYLISVIPITIPTLRMRREDIRPLASQYISNCARRLGKKVNEIEEEFWHSIENYDWPGNIQELNNAMEYVVNMMTDTGVIRTSLLPEQVRPVMENWIPVELTLEEMEREYIQRALEHFEKNGCTREEVVQHLGIGVATLYRKIKKYKLS